MKRTRKRSLGSPPRWLITCCFWAASLSTADASGLLWGEPSLHSFVPQNVDSALPIGARLLSKKRPALATHACSVAHPVCVHADDARVLDAALRELERSFRVLTLVASAPRPRGDGKLGGGSELDLYLLADDSELQVSPDLDLYYDDRTSGFCSLGQQFMSGQNATRCVTELIALNLDAAESPALRAGLGEYQSWLFNGPDNLTYRALDDAQANPQMTVVSRDLHAFSRASALYWAYLDSQWSKAPAGMLPFAFFRLSRRVPQPKWMPPPASELVWKNEPDSLDITRAVLGNDRAREAQLLSQWAISRAFLGNRNDNAHGAGLPWLGAFGRIRFDWSIKSSSLPRKVISTRAIEPLGSVYAWVTLDDTEQGDRLGVRVSWEAPVRFQWAIIAVDEQGREVTRWEFTYVEGKTELDKTLMNFNGASGLIIVGTNLGGVDLETPFDPDFEPWEPHRATIYLAKLDTAAD